MKRQNPPVTYYPQNAIRRRAKRCLYIGNGIAKLFTKPPVAILILLLLMAGIITTWKVSAAFGDHLITIPALIPVFVYTLRTAILLVVALLFVVVLYLIGIPYNARHIENDLATAFEIEKTSKLFYRCPFLVSCRPVPGSIAQEYVFWAKWLDVSKWNRPETKRAILWALYAHSDEDFAVGKGRHTVTICAAPGVVPEDRETPQDPFFTT